jgi:hypothetical protein
MQEYPYKIGTIKLTWINPKNYTILQSKMFDSVEVALQNIPTYIKKDEYMIFELIETDGVSYKWKLLPYGYFEEAGSKSIRLSYEVKVNGEIYTKGVSVRVSFDSRVGKTTVIPEEMKAALETLRKPE